MKYWGLIAIGVIAASVSLAAIFLPRADDPGRGVFTLEGKHIQIAQNEDGSVQWDGRLMTCDEISIVLHEAEKNCGRMPAPFDKIHFGPFECLSTPTPEELAGGRISDPKCPPKPEGSTFFTGSSDALTKLRDFAGSKGFLLEIQTLPDGNERIPLTPALLSNTDFKEIFEEGLSGKLGMIGLGSESRLSAQSQ